MRVIALAVVAALAAAPAVAAPAPVWAVDREASRLGFTGTVNGEAFRGSFRRWDAQIRFSRKSLDTSNALVIIDTSSVSMADKAQDDAVPTDDWLNVMLFPRAIFSATQFKYLGHGRYHAIGTLAIRNVRRPVVFPFTVSIKGDKATMRGAMTIDRRTYGVGQGRFAVGDVVGTKVRIEVSLTATRVEPRDE